MGLVVSRKIWMLFLTLPKCFHSSTSCLLCPLCQINKQNVTMLPSAGPPCWQSLPWIHACSEASTQLQNKPKNFTSMRCALKTITVPSRHTGVYVQRHVPALSSTACPRVPSLVSWVSWVTWLLLREVGLIGSLAVDFSVTLFGVWGPLVLKLIWDRIFERSFPWRPFQ